MTASSVLSETEFASFEEPLWDLEATIEHSPFVPLRSLSETIMSTVTNSLNQLKEMGLLTEEDLSICGKIAEAEDVSVDSLVDLLVEQGRLTKYQAGVICNRRPGMLVIGDYIIVDKLGAGGMGVVYKAYDRRMHREVAIKMLLESGQQSEEKIERFRREAIAAARMNHPNIVTAYAANEHEGYPYLVMEYVKGRDLGSLVKKGGQLPVAEAVNYILQTAVGMAYAHSRHIIHRDLKPSNLLLATPDDSDIRPGQFSRVKILDMGLARLTQPTGEVVSPALEGSDLSATGMLMGTVDYMAPEQAMDTKRADHRSDIYSLGCTLFYLLTKRPVYTGSNLLERISAHLKADIPSLKEALPEVPEELDVIFQKMVAKKPRDRYQSMTEVVEALQRIDRQLSGYGSSVDVWQPGVAPEGTDFAQPGSSYTSKSGLGTQGSAPTIASGSGPMGNLPGSSYGSTAYAEEFPSGGTITQTGMPLPQKLIVVMLLGMMAGIMGAIYWKLTQQDDTPPIAADPPPIYLPAYCQPAADATEVEVTIQGKTYRCYDVIELNVSQLPNLPKWDLGPNGPAIAEKPADRNASQLIEGELLVRFRLIPEDEYSKTRSFYMMETKVWSDLFRVFAETHPDKLGEETLWMENPPGMLPVYHVYLQEAYWFARWMGGNLPSAKEWDTAAGRYLPPAKRGDALGPYRIPEDGTSLKVAIFDKPEAVDAPTDDNSPFGILHMAGNGEEFTRTSNDIELGEGNPIQPDTLVSIRGQTYLQYVNNTPLTYELMLDKAQGMPVPWGTQNEASSELSFRVVLEISPPTEADDQNEQQPQESK